MKAIRKTVVAVTGVALALSLAACGGGDGGTSDGSGAAKGSGRKDDGADKALTAADPVAALKSAAAKGARHNTYRAKGKVKDERGDSVTEGAFQVKPRASDMKDTGRKTAEAPDGVTHVISVGDKMYFNSPMVPGKKWWTFGVGGAKDTDPSEPFVRMAGALTTAKDLKLAGVETVGGRRTAHYRGTVVVAELAAYKGDAMKENDRDFTAKGWKDDGMEKVALDVWVDGEGVIARTQEAGKRTKGDYLRNDEYSDFGAALKIQPPPAAETATEQEALEAQMKKDK
ncbi:hypothetical protein AF335_23780 [Streptomyces eurocidicus]|uniref:Lipoprotein n=1 Tax=Streptomyces eurocidicus TaxID=66423 RepID=A0A2N8NQQ6_STREU|nr:hypothetical protein [Streptomyces eurocidicus]MBB5116852.1 hypothetical protein [Streptomyces eurocidicus]MBF6052841.1 hypothetical protein [Streptomyces eurocidicus]PNE31104.1 hypothetical protein AF335_23780 [Streptomyces eurocidicus]